MNRKLIGTTGLVAAAAILVGTNVIARTALKGHRVDLTEAKLYTLSQGSKNIVGKIDEPITLRFFFSEKSTKGIPPIQTYAQRVRELLEEYASNSNGKIKLEIIDPEPFSEHEERALTAGIQGLPLPTQENAYFGLQGESSADAVKVIPFFSPDKEEFLEYDISSMIYDLANPKKRKVAILTTLPVQGADADYVKRMMGQAEDTPPWAIAEYVKNVYDVSYLDSTVTEIPSDVDLLWVIHPKGLPIEAMFAIDQYLMRNGKALFCVDPHCEADIPPEDGSNPVQRMTAPKSSEMPMIFSKLGIELVPGRVAADIDRAIRVPTGNPQKPQIQKYLPFLTLVDDDISRQQVPTSQIKSINVGAAGILRARDGRETTVVPILQTSPNSQQLDVSKIQFFSDPNTLLREFASENNRQTIGMLVTGTVATAFPEGIPGKPKPDNLLTTSKQPVNVAVLADVDMLTDRFWIQRQKFLGSTIVQPIANNGDLIANLVDYLGGSPDLIGIRSRGKFNRPFEVVENLQKEAETKFAKEEEELQTKLREAQAKMRELESKRPEGSNLILSQEEQAEIANFRKEQVETQRKLRAVQLQLRQGVEDLGRRIKFYNIGLVPAMVGILAVVLGIAKASRRRRLTRNLLAKSND